MSSDAKEHILGTMILNEGLYSFIARILYIHQSGALTVAAGLTAVWLVPRETAAVSAQVLCTPFNGAPVYSVTSFKTA